MGDGQERIGDNTTTVTPRTGEGSRPNRTGIARRAWKDVMPCSEFLRPPRSPLPSTHRPRQSPRTPGGSRWSKYYTSSFSASRASITHISPLNGQFFPCCPQARPGFPQILAGYPQPLRPTSTHTPPTGRTVGERTGSSRLRLSAHPAIIGDVSLRGEQEAVTDTRPSEQQSPTRQGL